MDFNAQQSAQQRADRIAAFRRELAQLEQDGGLVLTAEQRARLDAHLAGVLSELTRRFGVDVTESAKRMSWGMRTAMLLGGAALFAAVVLFLHRIWGSLPTPAHAPLLTAMPLLLLGAAELVFRKGFHSYITTLLALAAGAAFVLELNALAGTLNMAPSLQGLLAWALFGILVAYAHGARLLLGAGLLLLCVYSAALGVSLGGGYWENFPERAGFGVPVAAVLYAAPGFAGRRDVRGFDFVYRVCGAAAALIAFFIMSEVGYAYGLGLSSHAVESVCQLIGLGLSVGVVLHGLRLGQHRLAGRGSMF